MLAVLVLVFFMLGHDNVLISFFETKFEYTCHNLQTFNSQKGVKMTDLDPITDNLLVFYLYKAIAVTSGIMSTIEKRSSVGNIYL